MAAKTEVSTAVATITRKDVIDRLAVRTKLKRTEVKLVVQEMLDLITARLAEGDRLEFRDFGVFDVRERRSRMAKNPKTLAPVEVPSRRNVRFRPGRKLLDAVQQGDQSGPGGAAGQPAPRRPPDPPEPPAIHSRALRPDPAPRSAATAERRPETPPAYHRAP